MGKSTISMAIFKSFLSIYQAGYVKRSTAGYRHVECRVSVWKWNQSWWIYIYSPTSIHSSIHPSIHVFIFIYLCVYATIYPSMQLSNCIYIYVYYIYVYIYICVYIYIYEQRTNLYVKSNAMHKLGSSLFGYEGFVQPQTGQGEARLN